MSLFAKVFDSLQQAIVLADRVESLSRAVEDMAREMREMDRRLSRIEGAISVGGGAQGADSSPGGMRLLPPKQPES